MARGPLIVKEINAAVTAGTPATVWTPASGKTVRVTQCQVATSAAAGVLFKTGAGNTLLFRCPTAAINTPVGDRLGEGLPAPAADDVLKVDVTANATVTGFVAGYEE